MGLGPQHVNKLIIKYNKELHTHSGRSIMWGSIHIQTYFH